MKVAWFKGDVSAPENTREMLTQEQIIKLAAVVEVARAARSLLDVADDGDYDLPLVANDVRASLARVEKASKSAQNKEEK